MAVTSALFIEPFRFRNHAVFERIIKKACYFSLHPKFCCCYSYHKTMLIQQQAVEFKAKVQGMPLRNKTNFFGISVIHGVHLENAGFVRNFARITRRPNDIRETLSMQTSFRTYPEAVSVASLQKN